MTCEDFEVAIEQELRGALAETFAPALAVHVAGCARCQAYRSLALGAKAALDARLVDSMETVDWGRVERALRRDDAFLWRALPLAWLGVLLGAWGIAWSVETADSASRVRYLATASVPQLVIVTLALTGNAALARRRLRRFQAGGQQDLLAWLRKSLSNAVASTRQARWVLMAFAVLLLWAWVSEGGWGRHRAVLAIPGLVDLALLGWLHFLRLPRLLREQAALGPEPKS